MNLLKGEWFMKEEFEKSEIEIIRFNETEDVVTASFEVIQPGEPTDDFD